MSGSHPPSGLRRDTNPDNTVGKELNTSRPGYDQLFFIAFQGTFKRKMNFINKISTISQGGPLVPTWLLILSKIPSNLALYRTDVTVTRVINLSNLAHLIN